jgi:hypothetical protein
MLISSLVSPTHNQLRPHSIQRDFCFDYWTRIRLHKSTQEHAFPRHVDLPLHVCNFLGNWRGFRLYVLVHSDQFALPATLILFLALSADPLLVWNYGVMGVLAGVAGLLFWLSVRHLDAQEDILNNLSEGHVDDHRH